MNSRLPSLTKLASVLEGMSKDEATQRVNALIAAGEKDKALRALRATKHGYHLRRKGNQKPARRENQRG